MGSENCTSCGATTSTGSGADVVSAGKYAVIKDLLGNCHPVKGKPSALFVHDAEGSKPVRWRDGSKEDRIDLSKLHGKPGQCFNYLVTLDAQGRLQKSVPCDDLPKQIVTYEGGVFKFEKQGANRNCFPEEDIPEATGPWRRAAFTTCGPNGQTCLVTVPEDECEGVPDAGTVRMWGGTPENLPDWAVLCDGRIMTTDSEPTLFEKIGYNFGGSGSTFHAPDMRGVAPVGVDTEGVRDKDNTSRISWNGSLGQENIGSYQRDALQDHRHGGVIKTSDIVTGTTTIGPGGSHTITYVSELPLNGKTTEVCSLSDDDCDENAIRTSTFTRTQNIYLYFIISRGCV